MKRAAILSAIAGLFLLSAWAADKPAPPADDLAQNPQAPQPILQPTPVQVTNFPDLQRVQGMVQVGNLPEVQPVEGVVAISNLPAVQTVTGQVEVSNLTPESPSFAVLQVGAFVIEQSNCGSPCSRYASEPFEVAGFKEVWAQPVFLDVQTGDLGASPNLINATSYRNQETDPFPNLNMGNEVRGVQARVDTAFANDQFQLLHFSVYLKR